MESYVNEFNKQERISGSVVMRREARERVMTIIVVLAAVALPALVALAFGDPILTGSMCVIGLFVAIATVLFSAAAGSRHQTVVMVAKRYQSGLSGLAEG